MPFESLTVDEGASNEERCSEWRRLLDAAAGEDSEHSLEHTLRHATLDLYHRELKVPEVRDVFEATDAEILVDVLEMVQHEAKEKEQFAKFAKTLAKCGVLRKETLTAVASDGLYALCFDGRQLKSVMAKKRAQIHYRQRKYNVFAEQNEGYARLLSDAVSQVFQSGELTSESGRKLAQQTQQIVGRFGVDPHRLCDVLLGLCGVTLCGDTGAARSPQQVAEVLRPVFTQFDKQNILDIAGARLRMSESAAQAGGKPVFRTLALLVLYDIGNAEATFDSRGVSVTANDDLRYLLAHVRDSAGDRDTVDLWQKYTQVAKELSKHIRLGKKLSLSAEQNVELERTMRASYDHCVRRLADFGDGVASPQLHLTAALLRMACRHSHEVGWQVLDLVSPVLQEFAPLQPCRWTAVARPLQQLLSALVLRHARCFWTPVAGLLPACSKERERRAAALSFCRDGRLRQLHRLLRLLRHFAAKREAVYVAVCRTLGAVLQALQFRADEDDTTDSESARTEWLQCVHDCLSESLLPAALRRQELKEKDASIDSTSPLLVTHATGGTQVMDALWQTVSLLEWPQRYRLYGAFERGVVRRVPDMWLPLAREMAAVRQRLNTNVAASTALDRRVIQHELKTTNLSDKRKEAREWAESFKRFPCVLDGVLTKWTSMRTDVSRMQDLSDALRFCPALVLDWTVFVMYSWLVGDRPRADRGQAAASCAEWLNTMSVLLGTLIERFMPQLELRPILLHVLLANSRTHPCVCVCVCTHGLSEWTWPCVYCTNGLDWTGLDWTGLDWTCVWTGRRVPEFRELLLCETMLSSAAACRAVPPEQLQQMHVLASAGGPVLRRHIALAAQDAALIKSRSTANAFLRRVLLSEQGETCLGQAFVITILQMPQRLLQSAQLPRVLADPSSTESAAVSVAAAMDRVTNVRSSLLEFVATLDESAVRRVVPPFRALVENYAVDEATALSLAKFVNAKHFFQVEADTQEAIETAISSVLRSTGRALPECLPVTLWHDWWLHALGDLLVPSEQYEAKRAEMSGAAAKLRKGSELRHKTKVLSKLSHEETHLLQRLERVQHLLEARVDWLSSVPMEKRADAVKHFVRRCLLPRVRLSPSDALFCSRFLQFAFRADSSLPVFVVARRVLSQLSRALCAWSEDEVRNLARFVGDLLPWMQLQVTRLLGAADDEEKQTELQGMQRYYCDPAFEQETGLTTPGALVRVLKRMHNDIARVVRTILPTETATKRTRSGGTVKQHVFKISVSTVFGELAVRNVLHLLDALHPESDTYKTTTASAALGSVGPLGHFPALSQHVVGVHASCSAVVNDDRVHHNGPLQQQARRAAVRLEQSGVLKQALLSERKKREKKAAAEAAAEQQAGTAETDAVSTKKGSDSAKKDSDSGATKKKTDNSSGSSSSSSSRKKHKHKHKERDDEEPPAKRQKHSHKEEATAGDSASTTRGRHTGGRRRSHRDRR